MRSNALLILPAAATARLATLLLVLGLAAQVEGENQAAVLGLVHARLSALRQV